MDLSNGLKVQLAFVLVIIVSTYAIGAQRFLMGRSFPGDMLLWVWAAAVGWVGALTCIVIRLLAKLRGNKKDSL